MEVIPQMREALSLQELNQNIKQKRTFSNTINISLMIVMPTIY